MPQRKAMGESKQRGKLLTLTEISKLSGISMPTLQRYKKLYQERIPSVGEGRKQRYLKSSLPIFEQLKLENLGRRGRPRKTASAAGGQRRRGPLSQAVGEPGLLTLSAIKSKTGISYPTLVRYTKLHLRELPHAGKGRKRRFRPESVEVFLRLRRESRRGPQPKGGAARPAVAAPASGGAAERRLVRLERTVGRLEKQLKKLVARLSKPRRMI